MTVKEWIANGFAMGILEPDEVDNATFLDVYNSWFKMKSGKIKPESLDRIECTFNRWFLPDGDLLNMKCALIDETYLIEWLTSLLKRVGGVTEKEYGRIYQIVYGVMVYARDMDVKGVKLMDWERVKRYMPNNLIHRNKTQEKAIPRNDIETLFHAVLVQNIYSFKRSACLCLLANFYLGLRIGELASLTWRDVDFSRKCIYINKTATKYFSRNDDMERSVGMTYHVVNNTKTLASERVVPMCDEVVYIFELLREHHKRMEYIDQYLAYDGGQVVLVRSLDRTMRRLCDLCDIPRYNTHKIRKTFATYLHDSRVPIKTVSALLGHTNIETTARYYIKSDLESEEIRGEISGVMKKLVEIHDK